MSSVSAAYMVASAQKQNRILSTGSSPRTSVESQTAPAVQASPEKKSSNSIFKKAKKALSEHHQSVNAAYQAYYGMGQKLVV